MSRLETFKIIYTIKYIKLSPETFLTSDCDFRCQERESDIIGGVKVRNINSDLIHVNWFDWNSLMMSSSISFNSGHFRKVSTGRTKSNSELINDLKNMWRHHTWVTELELHSGTCGSTADRLKLLLIIFMYSVNSEATAALSRSATRFRFQPREPTGRRLRSTGKKPENLLFSFPVAWTTTTQTEISFGWFGSHSLRHSQKYII